MKKFSVAIMLLLVSSCAVRDYQRPVSVRERVEVNNAFAIDTISALALVQINTGPGYDMSRQRPIIDYSYYLDPRLKSDPRSFYPRPDAPPEVKVEPLASTPEAEFFLLSWPSQYAPQNPAFAPVYATYIETHTAYGVYCRSRKPSRGAVVVSHGWTGDDVRKTYKREPLLGFARVGYDSVLVQQPYHGLREPAGSKFSGEYFISGEIARTNEATCQTVTDVRSMVRWLREKYEVVGIRGGSLGGITTLQTAAVESEIDFAVAWVPPSSLGEFPEDSPLIGKIVKSMRESGITPELGAQISYVASPKNFSPAIPKKDILIIAGMGDNFVPPSQTIAVWEAFGRPMIYWFAGGHVVNHDRDFCLELERQFMAARLPGKKSNE